jgi:hypothetical protein
MEALDNVSRFLGEDLNRSIIPGAGVAMTTVPQHGYNASRRSDLHSCLRFSMISWPPAIYPQDRH